VAVACCCCVVVETSATHALTSNATTAKDRIVSLNHNSVGILG
jgi:hypothetical protein